MSPRSSETSAHIRTIWRYIQEDGKFHNYRCKNIKSYREKFPNRFCNADYLQEVKQIDPEEDEKVAVMTDKVQET
jgi:hypothetical protein